MPELQDSYSAQNDEKIYEEVDNEMNCRKMPKRLKIPAKTTPYIQPADYSFFRNCKLFAKRIANFVILEQMPINLKERNNIIMWSLIFN
jgi:hypothetical protein